MNGEICLEKFDFAFCKHGDFRFSATDREELKRRKVDSVTLPHDVALTVTGYKTPDSLYFGKNILSTQDHEDVHAFYFSEFQARKGKYTLKLSRIDCISEVYVNGEKVLETDNAFIGYEKDVVLLEKNTIVIHILPITEETKKRKPPVASLMMRYNAGSAYIRKPAHTFGWDILPRNVLGGIFGRIVFEPKKEEKIDELYFTTLIATRERAKIAVTCNFDLVGDDFKDYELEIIGKCGESAFYRKDRLWSNLYRERLVVEKPMLWDVKGFGAPNLYDLTVRLYKNQELIDERTERVGIRVIRLTRTSVCDENSGKFEFSVNGRKTFIMGTNWVPVDALYSKSAEKMPKAFALLDESGCNMVRVWGGGIYETDDFYSYCDERGILVWQDFMMACGAYPQDDAFAERIEAEASYAVKRLRNHPSLALWAGDNECDFAIVDNSLGDPNANRITRKILPSVLHTHGPDCQFLPSSPYYDEEAIASGKQLSEDHCWGPRDYFRSEYYKSRHSAFMSEIGYMGIPARASLERFIPKEKLTEFDAEEYFLHGAAPQMDDGPFAYRVQMMLEQIRTLFNALPSDLDKIILCSQISQGEAVKYFIERMRIRKEKTGGIIWWNLLDGWPQLSDSLVDYYFRKKLGFWYILRAQQRVGLLMDEDGEDGVVVAAVNDTGKDAELVYKISDALTGEVFWQGTVRVAANACVQIAKKRTKERTFYKLEWTNGEEKGLNHFVSFIKGVSFEEYVKGIEKCGINVWENV